MRCCSHEEAGRPRAVPNGDQGGADGIAGPWDVDEVVNCIARNACTGLTGDGKIYVTEVVEAVRISNGERGPSAI